jgi:flagellar basal-body rod protein FlgG
MMTGAQRRVDTTANNVSNMSTPAYRSSRVYSQIVDLRDAMPVDSIGESGSGGGPLKTTGNPLDIATDPLATIALRGGSQLVFTRSAQLRRDGEGRLIDGQGRVLQADGGGDVVLGAGPIEILKDGTILVAGQAQARIGMFEPGSSGIRSVVTRMPQPITGGVLHAGAVIASDVDLGTEMIELTKASRLAETGARVFSVYDDLLGQAASKLGTLSR